MTQQRDSMSELRAATALRELEKSKTGATSVFIRLTLAIIFMYLIFMSHEVLGVIGPAFISVLFLIALMTPLFYQILKGMLGKRRARSEDNVMGTEGNIMEEESLQEG